jgi:hypothetical protein
VGIAFKKLRGRKAFLDNLKGHSVFSSGVEEELDESWAVVSDLMQEYAASRSPDYKNWHSGLGEEK